MTRREPAKTPHFDGSLEAWHGQVLPGEVRFVWSLAMRLVADHFPLCVEVAFNPHFVTIFLTALFGRSTCSLGSVHSVVVVSSRHRNGSLYRLSFVALDFSRQWSCQRWYDELSHTRA